MLSVKKILAGRGAVNYYLEQTRRGLADYYLGDQPTAARTGSDPGHHGPTSSTSGEAGPSDGQHGGDGPVDAGGPEDEVRGATAGDASALLDAPGASRWGGGAEALELVGPVQRGQFVPLYTRGVRPDGGQLGRGFRTQEDVAHARSVRLAATATITDPYERWQAQQRLTRSGPQPSVAAWNATLSPVKSVSLLWAAGDRNVQQQVWAAHLAAVDAGLGYLEEHAGFVRAKRNGVRVLDTNGLVVARMNEGTPYQVWPRPSHRRSSRSGWATIPRPSHRTPTSTCYPAWEQRQLGASRT